jgi:hypothetical protein
VDQRFYQPVTRYFAHHPTSRPLNAVAGFQYVPDRQEVRLATCWTAELENVLGLPLDRATRPDEAEDVGDLLREVIEETDVDRLVVQCPRASLPSVAVGRAESNTPCLASDRVGAPIQVKSHLVESVLGVVFTEMADLRCSPPSPGHDSVSPIAGNFVRLYVGPDELRTISS